jgi:hypothetical protein
VSWVIKNDRPCSDLIDKQATLATFPNEGDVFELGGIVLKATDDPGASQWSNKLGVVDNILLNVKLWRTQERRCHIMMPAAWHLVVVKILNGVAGAVGILPERKFIRLEDLGDCHLCSSGIV